MPWVRIDEDAMTHPKIVGLSDKAFRLWVWGLSYAQLHLTDGLLPAAAIPARVKRAEDDLVAARLWEPHDVGFKVHDYLDWNESRETVTAKRDGAKTRLQHYREKRVATPPVDTHLKRVSSLTSATPLARSDVVVRSSLEKEEISVALDLRAGHLLERYSELFVLHRKGAKYHNRMHFDFPKACELVRTWTDDARLEKLAVLVLTTDEPWISGTDRGFGVFAARATWADDTLKKWEIENGIAV